MIFDIDKHNSETVALKDDSGLIFTYGDLVRKIGSAPIKLPQRSLVFILAENTVQVITFVLTCLEHRIVPLLLNPDLDSDLFKSYIDKYSPNAIFCNTKSTKNIKNIKEIISYSDYDLVLLANEQIELNESLSFLLPTSGSTGSPKLVRHSLDNLTFSAKSVSMFFEIVPNDVGLGALPCYYTMGFSVISSHLHAGATVVLTQYNLTDRNFWDILKNEKISILTGVPYTFDVLFKMRLERYDLPSLRIITQGGGKLPEPIWLKLANYADLKGIKFIPTYGQTEGTARMSFLNANQVNEKIGSIGKPIPGGFFEIWDENKKIINEVEATGELVYKGKNVTLGYAENYIDLLKGDERNGLLETGDIVKRDTDGFYFIVGRKKRFLKLFGLRISLDEIEDLVKNNFEVDCFSTGDDSLLTVYITNSDLLINVKNWLVAKTKLFHQAIEIKFVEEIPRNSSGKVIFDK